MKVYGIIGIMDGEVTVRPELYSSEGTAQEVVDVLRESTGFDRVAVAVFSLVDDKDPDPVAPKSDRERLVAFLSEIGIPYRDRGDYLDIGTEDMIDEMSYAQIIFNEDGSYSKIA